MLLARVFMRERVTEIKRAYRVVRPLLFFCVLFYCFVFFFKAFRQTIFQDSFQGLFSLFDNKRIIAEVRQSFDLYGIDMW